MQQIVAAARPRYLALALNVRADNPAFWLYQRLGFVVVKEMVNRVGGLSYDIRHGLNDMTKITKTGETYGYPNQ